MRTKRNLVEAVAVSLRITGAGQTPASEDFVEIAQSYDDLHARLVDRGLCYWTNTDNQTAEIPLQVFQCLVDILSSEVAGAFGKDEPMTFDDEAPERIPARTKGWRDLRRHMFKRPSGESTPFSAY